MGARIRRRITITAITLALLILGVAMRSPQHAVASRFCGTFQEAGLLTKVQVYANRYLACGRAIRVMKRRFNGDTPAGWSCVGPQTGYAKCAKGRRRVVAHF
jgi:hypothetical protein